VTEEIGLAFFERLVRMHERMVLGVAYRLLGRTEDAQDAAQEVFLKLLRKHKQIEGDPKPWLYRVTVNVCNDWYRRRIAVVEPDEEAADTSTDALTAITLDERKRLLTEALETLGERERAAIVLRDIEGHSTHEVAKLLGVEEVTVRSQISVARVKLAKYVRKHS
jgi:RNA polymerase sigma-70 factor (ECF subfamily)